MDINQFSGKWIVVEGPDRIGKTSFLDALESLIKSLGLTSDKILRIGFPQRSKPIGELLSRNLNSEFEINEKAQTMLFLADMLDSIKKIDDAKKDGKVILCDRYIASTYSYALAQFDIDKKWINKLLSLMPKPDITIFMMPSFPDLAKLHLRPGFGCERTEKVKIQRNVLNHMNDFAEEQVDVNKRVRIYVNVLDTKEEVFRNGIYSLKQYFREHT